MTPSWAPGTAFAVAHASRRLCMDKQYGRVNSCAMTRTRDYESRVGRFFSKIVYFLPSGDPDWGTLGYRGTGTGVLGYWGNWVTDRGPFLTRDHHITVNHITV